MHTCAVSLCVHVSSLYGKWQRWDMMEIGKKKMRVALVLCCDVDLGEPRALHIESK